jgi:hypothetical protein
MRSDEEGFLHLVKADETQLFHSLDSVAASALSYDFYLEKFVNLSHWIIQ